MIPAIRAMSYAPRPVQVAMGMLVLLVFLAPIVIVPAAVDAFVLSKDALLAAGVAMLAAVLALGASRGHAVRLPLHFLNAGLLALMLWTLASVAWSPAPSLAWEEVWRLGWLLLFAVATQSLVSGDRARLLMIMWGFTSSSTVLAAWVLVRDFRQAFLPGGGVRAVLGDWRDAISTAGLGNTSHIGDHLAVGFLCWLGVALLARRRGLVTRARVALWLHAAALIVAWSVHSNLSVLIGVGVVAWALRYHVRGRWLGRLRRAAAPLVIGWAVVVGFYVVDHPLNPHGSAVWGPRVEAAHRDMGLEVPAGGFHGGIFSEAFASPRWTSGFSTRLAIWYTTLEIIRTNPWLGVGAGNFTYVYPGTISPIVEADPELASYGSSWTNAAHNELLQFWAELGILGPTLLLLLLGMALKEYTDRLNSTLPRGNAVVLAVGLGAMAAQAAQAMMNFPLQLPVSSMVWVLLLLTPFMLPPRGAEAQAMMMPVERPYGPVVLGVLMKNMAYPTEVRLRVDEDARGVGIGVAAVAVLAGVALAWWALVPLRADIAYRPVREGRDRVAAGMIAPDALLAPAARVLEIWPAHVDCRSARQELLVQAGRWEEVVAETPRVLEKLNATEVYLRRAIALESMGRGNDAVPDWDEIFRRVPHLIGSYPVQGNAWLERHPTP